MSRVRKSQSWEEKYRGTPVPKNFQISADTISLLIIT